MPGLIDFRHGKAEFAALAWLAFGVQFTAMGLDDAPGNVQPQPGAVRVAFLDRPDDVLLSAFGPQCLDQRGGGR